LRVILAAGDLEAQVLPAAGGSLARLDWLGGGARMALLRGTDDDAAHALDCACFPLVPFCNRIRGGAFAFAGRIVRLAPNMPPDPSPLHGQGWLAQWQVASRSPAELVLRYEHAPGEWPWRYVAHQIFTLDRRGLSLELSCRNLSDGAMPCGLGFHPYYPCDAATRLDTRVTGAWTIDAQVLPVAHVPAEGRYNLADRAICAQDLDNGFDGWDGTATIRWGAGRPALRLTSPDARFFQVYSPATGGLFVAEPVQHANCALNAPQGDWSGLGIEVLPPGGERTLRARFAVVDQAPGSPAT